MMSEIESSNKFFSGNKHAVVAGPSVSKFVVKLNEAAFGGETLFLMTRTKCHPNVLYTVG